MIFMSETPSHFLLGGLQNRHLTTMFLTSANEKKLYAAAWNSRDAEKKCLEGILKKISGPSQVTL